jgi:thioredoxin reductase (NADPH)
MTEKVHNIIIIGAGPAGLSMAATLQMCSVNHIIFESTSFLGGQVNFINNPLEDLLTDDNSNGKDLVLKFENFRKKYKLPINFNSKIIHLNPENKSIILQINDKQFKLKYNILVLASGCRLKVNDAFYGLGFDSDIYHRISGQIHDFKGKTVAIVGNGDNAAIACLKLSSIAEKIIMINRTELWKARKDLIELIRVLPNVEIHYNTTIEKISGNQKIEKAILNTSHQKKGIFLDKVIFKIGYIPNTDFLKGIIELDNDGYVITKGKFHTSQQDIYAIGDLIAGSFKRIAIAMANGTELGNILVKQHDF